MTIVALWLWLIPRNLLIALLIGYRKVISPLYGDVCRYYPSCSTYGLQQLQQHGVVLGVLLTAWRILRCNPWSRGGIDEVSRGPRWIGVTRFGFVVPIVSVFVTAKKGN
ncbi:MAG: membrane protein insertion efficiency factor YidD [Micrococcales bacterium]